MFGRRRNDREKWRQQTGPLAAVQTPPDAGVLSCRVVDPVSEPVAGAEFAVGDAMGRKVVSGGTDPYGSFMTVVPAGEYRLAVSAEGYAPCRATALVGENSLSSLGDVLPQVAQPPETPAPGEWEIEPMHSSIGFTARHIGPARIHGRFDSFAGAVRIGERVEQSAVHGVIDAASIDTSVRMRDDHLRSADFLDVERFSDAGVLQRPVRPQGRQPVGDHRCADPARRDPHGHARRRVPRAGQRHGRRGTGGLPGHHGTAPGRLHREPAVHAGAGHRGRRSQHPGRPRRADRAQGLTWRSGVRAVPENVAVSDVRHVLVLPDRDAAEEAAEALGERFGIDEEPRLVRDALAGEDDAEDAQWLVVLRDEDGRLDPAELDAFAGEWDGWREEP
jgi:polyisoprenoid-binding protein YceI